MSNLANRNDGIFGSRRFGDTFPSLFDTFDSIFSAKSVAVGHFHTDLVENDENCVLRAELPGFERDDIEITFDDGVLRLTCERESCDKQEGETTHWQERVYGKFERTFKLTDIDPERINADLKQGVLTVTLGKEEATTPPAPKQIEIKTE